MVTYADTSFLLSLYVPDVHHEKALAVVDRADVSLVFTPIQQHELRNAVRLCVFRRELTGAEGRAVLDSIHDDLQSGFLKETKLVWAEVFKTSEALSVQFTETLGTRGMDVLHLAAARSIGAERFLTFDNRQKTLALKTGIKVGP